MNQLKGYVNCCFQFRDDSPVEYASQSRIDNGGIPIFVGRGLVLVSHNTELLHQHGFIAAGLSIVVVLDPFLALCHCADKAIKLGTN